MAPPSIQALERSPPAQVGAIAPMEVQRLSGAVLAALLLSLASFDEQGDVREWRR
jgi:hypothetical protein